MVCVLMRQAVADAGAADAAAAPATPPQEASIDEEDDSSEWSSEGAGGTEAQERVAAAREGQDDGLRVRDGSSAGSEAGSRRAGSIASTYWRPERTDRKEALSAIDEQCAPQIISSVALLILSDAPVSATSWGRAPYCLVRWQV